MTSKKSEISVTFVTFLFLISLYDVIYVFVMLVFRQGDNRGILGDIIKMLLFMLQISEKFVI